MRVASCALQPGQPARRTIRNRPAAAGGSPPSTHNEPTGGSATQEFMTRLATPRRPVAVREPTSPGHRRRKPLSYCVPFGSSLCCLLVISVFCLMSTITEIGFGRTLTLRDGLSLKARPNRSNGTDSLHKAPQAERAQLPVSATTTAALKTPATNEFDSLSVENQVKDERSETHVEASITYTERKIQDSTSASANIEDTSNLDNEAPDLSTGPVVDERPAAGTATPPRASYTTHGKGTVVAPTGNQPIVNNTAYFTLLADPRSGADMVMAGLNHHEGICASGGYPTAALLDSTMPWLADDSTEKGCTLAFVRESLFDLLSDDGKPETVAERAVWTPRRCAAGYDRTTDALQVHLERFCAFIQMLHGDFTNDAIAKVFMDAFVEGNQNLMGCSCPDTTQARGLKIMADWMEQLPLVTTVAAGGKVIRLTRLNLFERYMSFVTTSVSQYWSVSNVQDKEARMKAFRTKHQEAHNGEDYVIDIDWILFQFELMQNTDQIVNAWAAEYGGKTLWIDYENVRDDPKQAFAEMAEFLGVASAKSIVERALQESVSFSAYNGQSLLGYIGNRDALVEAFGAYGYNSFVGLSTYQPVQHIIYSEDKSLHTTSARKGLDVTVVVAAQDTSVPVGPSAKFHAVLAHVKKMPLDSVVVLSEGYSGTVNHHIRSLTSFYAELAKLRKIVGAMNVKHPGAVLVSASPECCSPALAHFEPGALFRSNGQRNQRTCSGDACLEGGSEERSKTWQTFMADRAGKDTKSDTMYLDGSFVVGTARDLIAFIEAIDIDSAEDDRAVLTDYMHQYPDKLILDYNHEVFGERFDGVRSKTQGGCEDTLERYETSTSPLFLHAARRRKCPVHYRNPNGQKFPVWDESGISVKPILDHIDQLFVHNVSLANIDPHFGSEIMYILDTAGIWGTEVRRDKYRVLPTEAFLTKAHNELILLANSEPNSAVSHRWSALQRTMKSTGFPYWAWYGDWKHCAKNNGFRNESIPLFTTCATTSCGHNFPSPSYMTIIDSQMDPGNWYKVFGRFDKDYAWESKIRKVVWRGGLTENDPTKVLDSQRWRLCKKVAALTDAKEKDMFDVGLTNIPIFLTAQIDIDASIAGGIVPGIGQMNDFQKYTAILDMDGNSWSSRFGTMLCYGSVAIKVEPAYADYFFFDLVPWKHYIPIKNDLSDLIENVAFALDPANEPLMKEMIDSANQWCSERFIDKSLTHDMLDIWESYLQFLDRADPKWSEEWSKKKTELFAPTSQVSLVQLK